MPTRETARVEVEAAPSCSPPPAVPTCTTPSCSVCTSPVDDSSPRLSCGWCSGVSICEPCFPAAASTVACVRDGHPFVHLTRPLASALSTHPLIAKPDTPPPFHRRGRFYCDGCDAPILGTMFHCSQCDDFDLCKTCFKAGSPVRAAHDALHAFVAVPSTWDSSVCLQLPPLYDTAGAGTPAPSIHRATMHDMDRITEIETWSFGEDGWRDDQLRSLYAPSKNKFLDVLWTVAPGGGTPTAVVAGYVAFKVKSLPVAVMGPPPAAAGPPPARRAAYVTSLAVCPSFRGKGFGRQLLRHVLTLCKLRLVESASLHVRVDNAAAVALYESEGFVMQRRVVDYYDDCDAFYMWCPTRR